VPFAEEGIAAGEKASLSSSVMTTVRAACRGRLTDPSAVTFIGDKSLYATPARAIATYRRLFEFHVAMGAGQVRIAGDVRHPGNGGGSRDGTATNRRSTPSGTPSGRTSR